ncbi:MFS transporter [Pontibacter chinhatensis]|uniref:Predicted arabinose efflux permease, MFS family n=1 Tax=Pontibacter chinhatensis TaxID=1436961 RepID=A0A1I2X5Z7_9BACT|nr:MFS transporter [Pontibacter chinhatensis]SFH08928.1 Predicted arabinose efflux permease, MFS family [Pontibacter chinhatensis]
MKEHTPTAAAGNTPAATDKFSRYQVFIVAILAILQFTIILDFIVLSPLGAQLIQELAITPQQFGWVVSAYAFSAGASGLLAAGFADRFDRKKLLLVFYSGFILGTLLCGLAPDYFSLLIARIVTGIFGGVIGSISFAIITDLFPLQMRGRVMGFVQMAFAVSQVMGIPLSLYLANLWGWHAPFLLLVGVSVLVAAAVILYMKPIDAHLKLQTESKAVWRLVRVVSNRHYLKGFGAIVLLATGGFMLMPFASTFTVYNLGISLEQLPMIYMVTGLCAMVAGPLAGKLSDQLGKYKVFFWGSVISMVVIGFYCNLGPSPLWLVLLLNVVMFIGITSRMVSATALMSAVPDPADRGAYMSIQSSVQQVSGGLATMAAGLIVVQSPGGALQHYDVVGYVVITTTLVTMFSVLAIDRLVQRKVAAAAVAGATV